MNNKKFSISKRTGIPIPTLHYYDEIGIFQPEKNPSSGHRIYNHQDIITLQKIISLKFLGYSLDKVTTLLNESSFNMDLNESLSLHLYALEKEKEQIEQTMRAIKRVITLVEEDGEVDSKKSEEDQIVLDKTFIHLTKEVKRLYGYPVEDLKVQEMVKEYLEASFSYLGENLIQKLADIDIEEVDIQKFENMSSSPFTEGEQKWLNQAMQYYMQFTELD
ncbi:MerR family transcriptional regulator [Lysinibacillus sp. KCTC 33748]|nr:MerR family transcriptional regulator [Lysinibacillus sp. KCTC 33748]SKB74172.1 transcriptional regulator, MerR family [Lysinibacillus sp. AC-3]